MVPVIVAFAAAYTGVSVYSCYVICTEHKDRVKDIMKSSNKLNAIGDLFKNVSSKKDLALTEEEIKILEEDELEQDKLEEDTCTKELLSFSPPIVGRRLGGIEES